jgi:hypothetical protein
VPKPHFQFHTLTLSPTFSLSWKLRAEPYLGPGQVNTTVATNSLLLAALLHAPGSRPASSRAPGRSSIPATTSLHTGEPSSCISVLGTPITACSLCQLASNCSASCSARQRSCVHTQARRGASVHTGVEDGAAHSTCVVRLLIKAIQDGMHQLVRAIAPHKHVQLPSNGLLLMGNGTSWIRDGDGDGYAGYEMDTS